MRFFLWGPKEEGNDITRIYFEDTDAYIWRRSENHPLEIAGASIRLKSEILGLLAKHGVNLTQLASLRELARALDKKGLLTGEIERYRSHFQYDDLPIVEFRMMPDTPAVSNVVQIHKYFKGDDK